MTKLYPLPYIKVHSSRDKNTQKERRSKPNRLPPERIVVIGASAGGIDALCAGWLFGIEDNGLGIDEDFIDDVFNMFVRLYSREEYPGEGIGLAICSRIVRRHGGGYSGYQRTGKGNHL